MNSANVQQVHNLLCDNRIKVSESAAEVEADLQGPEDRLCWINREHSESRIWPIRRVLHVQ